MNSTLPSSAQASLLHVFEKACQRSNPQKHTAKYLHRENAGFRVGDRVYPENTKISFIACGKAAAAQAKAVIAWAGNQLQNGLVIPPAPVEWNWPPEVAVHVASHPTPSDRSESAAAKAFELSEAVGPEGLLLACISGGASALLAAPRPPLNLNEQVLITKELLKSGVDIRIMNILRQQFSLIKGGGLAGGVSGRVETLIYSDIETESLDLIGSGPTLPMQRNQGEIIAQWESTQPLLNLPPKLQLKCDQLVRSEKNAPKNNQTNDAILCASPQTLKAIACAIAEESGFVIAPTQNASYGTSMDEVVQTIVETANALKRDSIKQATPMLAIWVREPALRVSRLGHGGRNSHLALLVAKKLEGMTGVTFLSAGSDGIDGSSEFAGACVSSQSWAEGVTRNLNPEKLLSQFDSADFHKEMNGSITTGPTGTNLTDLHLLLVEP